MNSSKAKKLLGFDLDLKFWQSIEIEYKYFPFGRKYLWGRKVKSLNETLFKFEQVSFHKGSRKRKRRQR